MKFYFDYIYYRMYKAFFKWDGAGAYRALLGITMIQTLLFSEVVIVLIRIFFSHQQLKPFGKILAWSLLIIGIIFYILNYKAHKGKYNEYDSYWKAESENKKILKGILVILSLTVPWVLFILMADFIG